MNISVRSVIGGPRWRWAIPLLLGIQLGLPILYYVGGYLYDSDRRDERFAWRMFSPIRSEKCIAQFFLGQADKPIRTSTFFHNAWVGLAARGRQQVIVAMAEELCSSNSTVRVRVQCEQYPGAAASKPGLLWDTRRSRSDAQVELVARGTFNFCTVGAL